MTTKTANPISQEEDVERLRSALMRLARDLRRTAAEEGLTPTQSSVLATVVRSQGISLTDLAQLEGLNPTMLSRVVGELEKRGLIARARHDLDKRSAIAKPTTQGKRLVQRLRKRRTEQLNERVELLDKESFAKILDALPALERLAGM